jgi:polysaccharide biosynthesis protein PslG
MIRKRRAALLLASSLFAWLAVSLGMAPVDPGLASAGHHRHEGRAGRSLVGLGDEHSKMFANRLWQQLHTRIVRYIAPYDAAVRPFSLRRADAWIHAAEARHQQILVAFYHSEYTPTKLPSVGVYQRDIRRFMALFPHVRHYQPWNEANRGSVRRMFTSPSAQTAARYYQALRRACPRCTVVGLDVLDQDNPAPTLRYIAEFKRAIGRLRTVMPKIWGLHDYSDVNRLQRWRTREIDRALGGTVWLSETGGIVKFGRAFPDRRGSGLWRAARVLSFTFALVSRERQVKHVYIYDWSGGTSATRFDAGLTDNHGRPRPGYRVLCRHMLGRGRRCEVAVSRH